MIRMQTSMGDIVLRLHQEETPKTVENFLNYVESGFYDGTIFHRVIDNFMIQGGGMVSDMTQKLVDFDAVTNEAQTAQPNRRGTIAMARTNDPHSATCQFFINVKDNNFLNFRSEDDAGYGYCVFGEVVEGMDVVDAIKVVDTGSKAGHSDVPKDVISIISVQVQDDSDSA